MRQLHDALLNSVGPISQPPFNGHLGARGNGNGHADHDVGGNGRTELGGLSCLRGRTPRALRPHYRRGDRLHDVVDQLRHGHEVDLGERRSASSRPGA